MGKRDTVQVPANRGRAPRATPVALRVVTAGSVGREILLPHVGTRLAVGSDHDNCLVVDDNYVSAFHCFLERSASHHVVVRDRNSTNGTWVNGLKVRETEVAPGARILIGSTTLLVVDDAEATGAAADLIGEDPGFRATVELARRAASTRASVLFVGESGTGKELFARLVHEHSPRAGGPFVALNCGAIARELIESELFGHEKGAFTGAHERRLGVFEEADGGTLFLDEIGELPREQQPRLLRALETRRVRRVGGAGERSVDVRVVAATHRDLRQAAQEGEFRLDLYHRLCGIELRLPALRERPTDIRLLVAHFLAEAEREMGARGMSAETLATLVKYAWPGNVRELRNAVHRAALLDDRELRLEHLVPSMPKLASGTLPPENFDGSLRTLLAQALAAHQSHRGAARALGMAKSTFHDHARRLGLEPPMSDPGVRLPATVRKR